eukprot:scaffold267282_cov15-Prasinocladus_malaysianus.AAC.1
MICSLLEPMLSTYIQPCAGNLTKKFSAMRQQKKQLQTHQHEPQTLPKLPHQTPRNGSAWVGSSYTFQE